MKGVMLVIENPQGLQKRLHDETNAKTRLKLAFLHCIATLSSHLIELCKSFDIAESTGYWWIRNWNAQGYDGLLEAETRSGRPPLLDDFDLSYLKVLLKEKAFWTLPEIAEIIETTFGVNYSHAQLARILKKRVNINCCKPYPHDYRHPQEAEAILTQRLQTVFITFRNDPDGRND
jgi:transposase